MPGQTTPYQFKGADAVYQPVYTKYDKPVWDKSAFGPKLAAQYFKRQNRAKSYDAIVQDNRYTQSASIRPSGFAQAGGKRKILGTSLSQITTSHKFKILPRSYYLL